MVEPIIALIIIGIGLIGVITLLTLPITTTIGFSGEGAQWVIALDTRIMGMKSAQSWQLPKAPGRKTQASHSDLKRIRQRIQALNAYRHFIRALWRKTSVTRFFCVGSVGLGEASTTAIITGIMNNLVGLWVSLHIAPNSSTRPIFGISPVWDRAHVAGEVTATLQFRVIDLTTAAIRAVYITIRR